MAWDLALEGSRQTSDLVFCQKAEPLVVLFGEKRFPPVKRVALYHLPFGRFLEDMMKAGHFPVDRRNGPESAALGGFPP